MDFNSNMSSVRVSVEWNYKEFKQNWASNDFPHMLKVRQSPISLLYISSALFMNVRTCLYKEGQVESCFGAMAQ